MSKDFAKFHRDQPTEAEAGQLLSLHNKNDYMRDITLQLNGGRRTGKRYARHRQCN